MVIEINNGCKVEFVRTKRGIAVHHKDENNCTYDIDTFDEGEIIMALNLLRNMRSSGKTTAWLLDDFALKILRESRGIDYAEDYLIFQ